MSLTVTTMTLKYRVPKNGEWDGGSPITTIRCLFRHSNNNVFWGDDLINLKKGKWKDWNISEDNQLFLDVLVVHKSSYRFEDIKKDLKPFDIKDNIKKKLIDIKDDIKKERKPFDIEDDIKKELKPFDIENVVSVNETTEKSIKDILTELYGRVNQVEQKLEKAIQVISQFQDEPKKKNLSLS